MTTTTGDNTVRKLTPKQERFCLLYATDKDFFGNATRAYIEAYNVDLTQLGAYQTARACAAENLSKPHLLKRINDLLEDIGFDDVSVDKQHAFVIMQHADLKAKMTAIKEYNTLKKRTAQRLEIDDLRNTRNKIKDFLDERGDDDAAADGPGEPEPDAPGAEPAGPAPAGGAGQVA